MTWIFGYGSLIWKADFPYSRKEIGYIKGFVRRFWQASVDHRGTPEKPGRVATLVKSDNPEDVVWGVAYEIPETEWETTLEQLDVREAGGYCRDYVDFHPRNERRHTRSVGIYLGCERNPFFTGPDEDEDELAEVVVEARGYSGPNTEYLYRLAEAVRTLMPHVEESHLFLLESKVRELEQVQAKEAAS